MHHGRRAVTSVSALVLATVGGSHLYVGHQPAHAADHVAGPRSPASRPVKGNGHLAAKPKAGQPFTVLILGTDSRAGTGTEYGTTADACGCSDTIILARVNPQTNEGLAAVDPARHPGCSSPARNVAKLNSAFGRGPDNSVATIEKALNIPSTTGSCSTSPGSRASSTPSAASSSTSRSRSGTRTPASTSTTHGLPDPQRRRGARHLPGPRAQVPRQQRDVDVRPDLRVRPAAARADPDEGHRGPHGQVEPRQPADRGRGDQHLHQPRPAGRRQPGQPRPS